jgi:hypothetical protein
LCTLDTKFYNWLHAVTVGNFDDQLRRSNAGWQLIAILPCLEEDQGNYSDVQDKDAAAAAAAAAGADDEEEAAEPTTMPKTRRKMVLFHDCIKTVCKSICDAFEKGEKVLCGDGFVRNMKPLTAAWLGDKEEHWVICQNINVRILGNYQ